VELRGRGLDAEAAVEIAADGAVARAARKLADAVNVAYHVVERHRRVGVTLPALHDEAVEEHGADHAVALGDGADHLVGELPVTGDVGAAIRVAGDDGA